MALKMLSGFAAVGEQRELVRGILHCILDAGYSPMKFFAKDYKKYFYLAELCSLVDLSAVRLCAVLFLFLWFTSIPSNCCLLSSPASVLRNQYSLVHTGLSADERFAMPQMVKMGVQYSLWGGSVVNLGTEAHHRKYFDDIDTFRLPGTLRLRPRAHLSVHRLCMLSWGRASV